MTLHDDHDRFTTAALDGATMDDELCAFVHTLIADGRPVPDDVAQAARRWAAEHASAAALVADLETLGAALERDVEPSAGFTDAVLAARGPARVDELATARARSGLGDLIGTVQRVAVAAALAIVATIGYGLAEPDDLFADDDPASLEVRQTHHADAFVDPSGSATPEAFDAGLDGLIAPDPRLSDDEREQVEERR